MKQFSKNIPKSSYLGKSFWVINSINSVIFSKYPDNCVNKGKDRGFKREISNYIKYSWKDTVRVEFIFKIVADSLSLVFICCNNLLFSPVACCSLLL